VDVVKTSWEFVTPVTHVPNVIYFGTHTFTLDHLFVTLRFIPNGQFIALLNLCASAIYGVQMLAECQPVCLKHFAVNFI